MPQGSPEENVLGACALDIYRRMNASLLQDLEAFAAVLEQFHSFKAQAHTGPVIVHFAQGQPNSIELPGPARVIKLDRRKKLGHH